MQSLAVVVDPSSWWMEGGTNATLAASWVGIPAGCALTPIWFRWSIAPGGSEGVLGPTNASETEFSASEASTGMTSVLVRAAASVDCGGSWTTAASHASSAITVAAPLAIGNLSFRENPVAPGSTADLQGSLVGGDPPYRLRVSWGDGLVSYANASGPGPFAVAHAYEGPGTFVPAVLVTDAAGRSGANSPQEPLYVNPGFAAAIVPSSLVAEEGLPTLFQARTSDAPPTFSWLFACGGATPAGVGESTEPSLDCAFVEAGVAPVSFQAVGGTSPYTVATATLDEIVVPPPTLSFLTAPPTGEVGQVDYTPLTVTGGVPPLTIAWSLVGAGTGGTELTPADGTVYLPLRSGLAGELVLSVVAVDALGTATASIQTDVAVLPALETWAAGASAVVAGAVELNVSASVLAGTPPFDWAVVPSLLAGNGSAASGTLPDAGSFDWNATFRAEGSLSVTVVVADAAGASATVNLSLALAPQLSVSAEVEPAGPGAVDLALNISGGIAPFAFRWNDTLGDLWNGSTASRGLVELREAPGGSGDVSFGLLVTDALGVSATSKLAADVPPDATGPAPGMGMATVAGGVALLATGTTVALLFRRRRPVARLPPDPVEVLREAIEPADGVDRGLVELLAEERGVPPEIVRSTLERLKADGTVRAGRGTDGEEVLAWVAPRAR